MGDLAIRPRQLLMGLSRIAIHSLLKTTRGPPPRPPASLADGILVARAETVHLDEIAALYRSTFNRSPPRGLLSRLIRFFPQLCLVALHEGKVVAFALCSLELRTYLPPKRRGSAFLATIAVREAFRGQGVARSLIEILMDVAVRDLRIGEFSLEVERENHGAIHLYRSLGFLQVENVPGESPNSVFMARPLSLADLG